MDVTKPSELDQTGEKLVTVVSMRDHGKGVLKQEFGNLFGRYVQLEISKAKDHKFNEGASNGVNQSPSGTGAPWAQSCAAIHLGDAGTHLGGQH